MTEQCPFITSARRTIDIEHRAIGELSQRLGASFTEACERLLNCSGRIIVTGMGKSGHIASKIAATLSSTGSPAFFVHPAEASHGDLGMITDKDVVLALSYSGTTSEIMAIVPMLKRQGIVLISMTGAADSPIAQASDIHIDASVREEACPLGQAPTTSTTVARRCVGDAIAMALLVSSWLHIGRIRLLASWWPPGPTTIAQGEGSHAQRAPDPPGQSRHAAQ